MSNERTFTPKQAAIVKEYVDVHGLTPEQITFDGLSETPIFDHIAVSVLSLKLTDIQDISPSVIENDGRTVTVQAKGTLPDGRSRGSFGSCAVGDVLAGGQSVDNIQVAMGVATSRAFRSAIRNLGIDLHAAHRQFLATGEVEAGHTSRDPRHALYAEIHVLATEIDLIIDGNKAKYQAFLAENFDGRVSAKFLNDVELHRLLITFRSLSRLRRTRIAA